MNKKLSILLIIFTSCLQLCIAEETSNIVVDYAAAPKAINDNSSATKEIPVITNEAEYAAWVRQREKIHQSSSSKSVSFASSSSVKIASSTAKKAVK